MVDVRLIICVIWIVIMLIYLLGDIIRFLMGDMKPGELNGMPITQGMALTIAVIMLVPIMMVFLTLVLPHPLVCTVNIGVAIVVFLFNLMGFPSYPGAYDRFLLAVSMVFNLVTVWYAWNWI